MTISQLELEEACKILRQKNQLYFAAMLEAQQATIERLHEERDLLRRLVRSADYWVSRMGPDATYGEARIALSKFDEKNL